MKPKNNRIIAARFRAQRLAQAIIEEGVHTPHGWSLLHKLTRALMECSGTLATIGMTARDTRSCILKSGVIKT